jgi:WD40 repeat protein
MRMHKDFVRDRRVGIRPTGLFAAIAVCLVSIGSLGSSLESVRDQASRAAALSVDIAEQRERDCCDALALDNEGRLLATAAGNEVTLWDLDTGLQLRTLVPRAREIGGRPNTAIPSVSNSGYSGLAFDPSGRYVALTYRDNENLPDTPRSARVAIPHVWEVESGRDLSAVEWKYDSAERRTVSVAFPFDPTETLFWRSTTNPAVVAKLARYTGPASMFSADGRLGIGSALEGHDSKTYAFQLTAVDIDSNRRLWTKWIPSPTSTAPTVTMSSNGRWVAVATFALSWILDARTGEQIADFPPEPNPSGLIYVPGVVFSRDSQRMAIVRKDVLTVVDISDMANRRSIGETRVQELRYLRGVTFTPDGQRIMAISGKAIHVWDINSRENRRIPFDGARPLGAIALSPGGRWLATGTTRVPMFSAAATDSPSTVVLWPLNESDAPRSLWTEEDVPILALAFSPDEERIGAITFREIPTRGGPDYDGQLSVHSLAASGQGTIAASTAAVRTARLRNPDAVCEITPGVAAKDLAFTPDGATIVAASLGLRACHDAREPDAEFEAEPIPQLILYDARGLQPLRVLDVANEDITALAMSSDGSLIATGHDANTVRVWTRATARQRALFIWPVNLRHDVVGDAILPNGLITGLSFHPDGRRLAVARDEGVALVDLVRRTRRDMVTSKEEVYSAVTFSPDGSSLLVASVTTQGSSSVDGRISQWVTATMRPGWTVDLVSCNRDM